jgi:DDE superfamily endonuclease
MALHPLPNDSNDSPMAQPQPQPSIPRLLAHFLAITAAWVDVFATKRTFHRAVAQALGGLLCLGRRTLSRILWTNGKEQSPWAADYHLHSRSEWEPQALFDTIWKEALPLCKDSVLGVALDDTKLHKTGRCIKQAFYQRDPLGPAFHVNLMLGLRFLQCSLLVPGFRGADRFATRALPVHFEEVSRVKRPGKKASDEVVVAWKKANKEHNLSQTAVKTMQAIREAMDRAGGAQKTVIMAGDGSFCNKACFKVRVERLELMARCRKDAVLCLKAEGEGARFYSAKKFRPEEIRQNTSIGWCTITPHYGGKKRKVRYKEVKDVYWQGGAGRRPLRLIVIAPTPYRKRKGGKLYYRAPAYLLTTDLKTSASKLIQIYLDRWQIEVNHREEKDTLGVGQAQLWNEKAVPRQPVLAVAAYSALLLAGLKAFGVERGAAYAVMPKWRSKRSRRPSCQDLVALLRQEATQTAPELLPSSIKLSAQSIVAAAAA